MPISRTSIIRGPAIVEFNSAKFYSKGDIELELGLETLEVSTSVHGKVDERVTQRVAKVRFTPAGEWESLGVLWPYASLAIGSSIFGAVDLPLKILTKAGTKLEFRAAAVTAMPDIILSAQETMIGQVEFTCLGSDNMAWTTAESLVDVDAAVFDDATFASSSIKVQPYSAAWGVTAPWDAFTSMDGFRVAFGLSTNPIQVDSEGVVDHLLTDLSVSCRCRPIGVSESQLIAALNLQGASAARGRSLNSGASSLVISGTGVSVTLTGAAMRSAGMTFGALSPRVGEVEFVATRTYAAGVANPLFSLT